MFLTLNDFEIHYPDFKVSINSLSLDIGSIVAVVGSNGSGKTTFIEGVLGVQQGVFGSKSWRDGSSVLDKSISGVQLQKSGFGDQMLVEDICHLHESLYKRQDSSIFKDFQIKELLGKQYRNLSRGQKQRVDLFVAMAHQPAQIFLDEPKTGLDTTFSEMFMSYLNTFASNSINSAIYACHSPEELQVAEQVLWLDRGEVKDFGDKELLFRKHLGEYKVYFKDLSDKQTQEYCSTIFSLNSTTQEPYIKNGSFLVYGDTTLKEWAERTIKSDNIVDYSISSVKEVDFLEYLTRKDC